MMKLLYRIFSFLISSFVFISCHSDPKSDKVTLNRVKDSIITTKESSIAEKQEEVKSKKKKVLDTSIKNIKKQSKFKPKNEKVKIDLPSGAPSFKGDEARRYVRDYERYVSNLKKAVEAKDIESFLKLGDASSNLTKQYNTLIGKLPADEIAKMSKYMKQKTRQLDELTKKMY